MARTRTTKAVAQRIDLNYFKRPTPFKRAKVWLALLAPGVALLWIGLHFFARDDRVYSSGRLGTPHAILEKQCAACHVQSASGFTAKAADSACLACHDGPPHHPVATNGNLACAECHVEHRGGASLVATKNESCARCHGDLSQANRDTRFAKQIRTFADGHPEFAALRAVAGVPASDSGTIKLNHALHMRLIRRGPTGPMVQLDCQNCHSTAAAKPDLTYSDGKYRAAPVSYQDSDVAPPVNEQGLHSARPMSGRELMTPAKFANACAACHLLTFDKRFDEGVPHDKPEVVHAFLVKKFSSYIAAHPAELRDSRDPQRGLAGKPISPEVRTFTSAEWVSEKTADAEILLWRKTCNQCHALTGYVMMPDAVASGWAGLQPRTAILAPVLTSPTSHLSIPKVALPNVTSANIRLQWLPHARFDHEAHRGFSCTGCHQNALQSTETSDILIPGIAVCQKCHAPGPEQAESKCFACHTYHDWAQRKEVKPMFTPPQLQTGGN